MFKKAQNRSKSSKLGSKQAQIDRKRAKFTVEFRNFLDHWSEVVGRCNGSGRCSSDIFGTHFGQSLKCQFAGLNSIPGDACEDALLWFMLFNIISTINNILMFLILKEGSAVLFIIIKSLKTPITSYLGSFPQLAGISASPVTIADWYAFVMLIVASIVYYYNTEENGISLDGSQLDGSQLLPDDDFQEFTNQNSIYQVVSSINNDLDYDENDDKEEL